MEFRVITQITAIAAAAAAADDDDDECLFVFEKNMFNYDLLKLSTSHD